MPRPSNNNLCPRCKARKRDGRQPYCTPCLKAYHKAWRKRRRNLRAQYQRLYRLRKIREKLQEARNPSIATLGEQNSTPT